VTRLGELLGRAPRWAEAVLFGILWSEHCSYKSTRHLLSRLPTSAPQVILGPGEDAGVVALPEPCADLALVLAHESHNHPSQVLPVEGAATGVGGIVRDIVCMGAEVVGVLDALRFGENSHGKPILADGPCFSLSHSADMMMLAIGDAAIGCDVERIDPALDWPPLAETFFTATERAALAALPPEAARRAFFACWARKEAFVKALGLGLSWPLDAFDVSVGATPALLSGGAGWAIAAAPDVPGFATAIVAHDDGTPLIILPLADPLRAAA